MTNDPNTKIFDLDERTLNFARRIRVFIKLLPKNMANFEDISQLVRSSGSVGANYIEANDSLSKKDFYMRIKICRKEAKESQYWLKLIDLNNSLSLENECKYLQQEAFELTKIFGAILAKSNQL